MACPNRVASHHATGWSSEPRRIAGWKFNPFAMQKVTRIFSVLSSLVVTGALLRGAENFDLSRFGPVPENEPIPLVDFFRPPLLHNPKLSPLGTHIAALVTNSDDKYQIFCYNIATGSSEMVGGSGDRDISQVTWLNDTRLVFNLSSEKLYGFALLAADVGRLASAYPLLQFCEAHLVSVPREQRTRPLFWARAELDENGRRDGGVLEIDSGIRAGDLTNLRRAGTLRSEVIDVREANEKHIRNRYPSPPGGLPLGFIADKEGKLEYGLTSDDGVSTVHRWTGKRWQKCPIDLEETGILGCGEKPGELLVLGPRQPGKPRPVHFMDAATGKLGDLVLQDKSYDFHGWFYRDPLTRNIVGAVYDRHGPQATWFTEEYKNLQKILSGFFPGLLVRILGSDDAQNLFLVETRSDRQPSIYSWVNLEKRTAGLIKNAAPWIDPKRMQPMSTTKFKTRDGYTLDAYVTLPAGATKANPPPLVVFPHGGPWARDTWGFNGAVQFLASRGYAVLQPNYRGSVGYGWMFPVEDDWDFRKMHDDVTDATKALITSGLVDGERIAIMGGSFGGYLAVSGVVNEPALYRCAVTMAGVFDWGNMIKNSKYDQYTSTRYARLVKRLGDPKKETEKFDTISPLRRVDQIRVPVFVAHGKEDVVVDVSESKQLISKLEANNIPHEHFLASGEGHSMAHLTNRVELFRRIEAFLAKNLLPTKSASANSAPPTVEGRMAAR